MTVGKVTKIFLAVVVTIILLNVVYFAFNYNVWLGVGALIATGLIEVGLYKFIKKPLTEDGRFW